MDISHTTEQTESGKIKKKKIKGTSTAEHTSPFGKTRAIQFYLQFQPVMEPISAAEDPQIKMTSADNTVSFGVKNAYDIQFSLQMDTEIEATSAAERMESRERSQRTQIEGTTVAAEHTESWERTQWPTNSIFRAPAHIRYGRESYFEPKLVSIGPYYHGQENLRRMEDLKHQCVPDIRGKQGPFEAGIPLHHHSIYNVPIEPSSQRGMSINGESLEQFKSSGRNARVFYKEEFNQSDVEFVKMLVIDSCFIIRAVLSLSQLVQESMAFLDVHIKEIRSDLLLLENQIPLFFIMEVYDRLFDMPKKSFPPFYTVLEPFICLDIPWTINHEAVSSKAAHLLDLYWRCSLSPEMYMELTLFDGYHSESESEHSTWAEIHLSNNSLIVIANATELQKIAGIEFEKFKDKSHLDVTFCNGIMRMPRLKIDSRQIILLRNLIAFENCILPKMRIISCYRKLMYALIDTEEDVILLQKCGVIYNTLDSHEMAANFFNDIGNFCFIDNNTNPFFGLYKNVQEYYDSIWHRRWASLRHNYFNSPWAGISVVAGVILLILSVVDTFYNIYGYHYPKN